MGLPVNAYRDVELLRSSARTRVFSAVRRSDELPVVAKVFDIDDGEVEARVEHEFALLAALELPGVIRPLELSRVGDQLVLLLERAPGVDLARYAGGRPMPLARFFEIAIEVSEILARVHARRVIHRDIKPANIIVDPATGWVTLADFGVSVLLEREQRAIHDPAVVEGTLPYLSPEQTGRTGRPVDARSDLYSLGVTFYELLTGRRPFAAALGSGPSSPLELIHAHLARAPPALRLLRPGLPDALARLVDKLLAKAPEHRYQTARGLAADLRRLQLLHRDGDDGDAFELGREDVPVELQLPHQLHGRGRERAALVEELELVARGETRLLLLSGPAGVGKSALVHDFAGELTRVGGALAVGGFERGSDRPYAGFVEAFGRLADQLLTEPDAALARRRAQLVAELGGVAGVVNELLPRFALILGEQPPLPALEPRAARNRLELALARLVNALVRDGRPLVLVLEDLQWADPSSVALLESLAARDEPGPLLLIASVRDESGAALRELGERLARVPGQRQRVIELAPLGPAAVFDLLADTLGRRSASADLTALAEIVTRKTGNNPLLIRQLLSHFAEAGLLRAEPDGWTWDAAALAAVEIPNDAVALMRRRLTSLPAEAGELLRRAACIGERIELASLRLLSDESRTELTAIIYSLVDAGLLLRVGDELRFAHRSLREAALAEVDRRTRARLRWQVGRRLLAELDDGSVERRLFEIVDHLDAGIAEAGEDSLPPTELAALELRAGRRAFDSAAHEPALHYLEQAVARVDGERAAVAERGPDAPHYALLVELELAHARALASAAGPSAAESAFARLLELPLRVGDHGRVAASRIAVTSLAGRTGEAVEFGRAALARHGCVVPSRVSWLGLRRHLIRAWRGWRGFDDDAADALPRCEDPRVAAQLELLEPLKSAIYVLDPRLYLVLIGVHARTSLAHGRAPGTALNLAQLAIGIGAHLGRFADALALAELATQLAERDEAGPMQVRVECAARLFVAPLGRPFAGVVAGLGDLYARALEAGDLLWAGYVGGLGPAMHLEIGTHLQTVRRLGHRFERELGARASREAGVLAATLAALASSLLGDGEDEGGLAEARATLDPARLDGASRYARCVTHGNAALVELVLGREREALRLCVAIIHEVEQAMFGSWMLPRFALTTLIAAHRAPTEAGADRARRRAAAILRRWRRACPANFGHYHELAAGLRWARLGLRGLAARALERARIDAGRQGCRWVEGLAAEQLAELAASVGLDSLADGARAHAWDAYRLWGAGAKLELLRALADEREVGAESERSRVGERSSSHTPMTSTGVIDLEALLRSVTAISADLRVEQVVDAALDAALASAGADRALLALDDDGELVVIAIVELDDHRTTEAPTTRGPALSLTDARDRAPTSLIRFVSRTAAPVVVDDVAADPRFADDPYLRRVGVRSLLGLPVSKGQRVLGVLVLENRQSPASFTAERLEVLRLIAGQASSALEHARVHAALREGEARWRSLVDGIPDLVALLDERGEVELVNRGAELFERIARSLAPERWRRAVELVLERGGLEQLEVEAPSEVAASRWYELRIAAVELDARAGGRKAIAIATEVSARKRAEADARQLEARTRQQQRLESVGTLAAGVAHEINNPIQGIMNYAELIAARPDDHGMVREFAEEITQESDRVATIVRNLLAFSRHEGVQPRAAIGVEALVEGTLSLVRSIMRRDQIELRIELPRGLPAIGCQPQQIQQILMNLVTNARDALRDAGGDEPCIEIRAEGPVAGCLRIIVEDNGPGVPELVRPHIFDPFFTTKGRDRGTGLGLAVSHGIARDHGGDLWLEERPGGGARFVLSLPIA